MQRIKKLLHPVIAGVLVLSLVLAAGCQLTSKIQTSTSTSPVSQGTTTVTNVVPASGNPNNIALASVADVVALVKPSVVAITVKTTVYDFFGRAVEQEGAGSGWIISTDGWIVTNNHVIDGATSILVTFNDGTSLPVDLKNLKSDSLTDLAVLKVNASNLPAIRIGDSALLREGEWVVAVGNSLGEGIRVTQGIISRKNVSMQDENGNNLEGLLETDAVINPGNSGGPLVNMAGAIIGITNAKRVQTGVEGVGYAISIDEALPIIQQLINTGYIVRPYFGISAETVVNASYAQWYGLATATGARIINVGTNSPANKVGIQINDVIVKFNGQDISDAGGLIKAIGQAKVGQTVDVALYRGNSQMTLQVTLGESPKPQ